MSNTTTGNSDTITVSQETKTLIDNALGRAREYKTNAINSATVANTKTVNACISTVDKCVTEASTAASNAKSYRDTASAANTNAQKATTSSEALEYYNTANTAKTNANNQLTKATNALNLATTISKKVIGDTALSDEVSSKITTITTHKNNVNNYVNSANEYASSAYEKYTDLKTEEESYNGLLNKTSLTEAEFLELVNAGGQSKLSLGTEITLPNSYGKTNVWVVIGTNHDNTVGTVDLMSRQVICDETGQVYTTDGGVWDPDSQIYEDSTVRKWLNNSFITGFSTNIRNALKVMEVSTDVKGTIKVTNDKIKLPSMKEVGLDTALFISEYLPPKVKYEGTMYPAFESGDGDSAKAKRIKYDVAGKYGKGYWTRTYGTDSSGYVFYVNFQGGNGRTFYNESDLGMSPIIRF